jgi:hypothetical protein
MNLRNLHDYNSDVQNLRFRMWDVLQGAYSIDTPPNSLKDSNASPKMKTMEK